MPTMVAELRTCPAARVAAFRWATSASSGTAIAEAELKVRYTTTAGLMNAPSSRRGRCHRAAWAGADKSANRWGEWRTNSNVSVAVALGIWSASAGPVKVSTTGSTRKVASGRDGSGAAPRSSTGSRPAKPHLCDASEENITSREATILCLCLDGPRGVTDHVEDEFRVREHRNVAAVDVIGLRAHALGGGPLQVGVHGTVIVGDDVPARLRAPSHPGNLL